MLKYFYLFAFFYSNFLLANDLIVGGWSGKSNDNNHVYSLDIIKSGNDIFLSYVFIYDQGRKINDQSSERIHFKKTSEQCWSGDVNDFFLEKKTTVILCRQDDSLVWEAEISIPYVPQSEVFIEQ